MKPMKGYYSIIQYCPDRSRGEAANIGVLLFCPESGFLKAKTSKGNQRIRKFFGSDGHDWKRIDSFKRALRQRLRSGSKEFRTIEDLEQFIAVRANEIAISPPRSIRVTCPEEDLARLYEEVVGTASEKEKPAKTSLRVELSQQLADPSIAAKVERGIQVTVPAFQKVVDFPFGYQNGRFNLINPERFEAADPDSSLRKACKLAVEGDSLASQKHEQWGELRLVIVAKFRDQDQETPERVRRIFEPYDVRLFPSEQISDLVDEIRRTGKVLASPAAG